MEARTSPLLSPVALFFLLVLGVGAQGGEDISASVIFHGRVQCSNNPSTVVSNATVQVVINGTTVVATGQTTDTGRFMIAAEAKSEEELFSLLNKRSLNFANTAPPHACRASAGYGVVKLDEAPLLQDIVTGDTAVRTPIVIEAYSVSSRNGDDVTVFDFH